MNDKSKVNNPEWKYWDTLTKQRLTDEEIKQWIEELKLIHSPLTVENLKAAMDQAADNWGQGQGQSWGKPALAQVKDYYRRITMANRKMVKLIVTPETISQECDKISRERCMVERWNMIVRFSSKVSDCEAVERACMQRGIKFDKYDFDASTMGVNLGENAGLKGLTEEEQSKIKVRRRNLATLEADLVNSSVEMRVYYTKQIQALKKTIREAEEKSRAITNQQKEVTA